MYTSYAFYYNVDSWQVPRVHAVIRQNTDSAEVVRSANPLRDRLDRVGGPRFNLFPTTVANCSCIAR